MDEWIDEVRGLVPGLVTERIDVDQPGSQSLYVQLIEYLNSDAAAGKTPAVFAATGALIGEDISVPQLADLAACAAGIPSTEWDPRLQTAVVPDPVPVTSTEPVLTETAKVPEQTTRVAPPAETPSPRVLPPFSASLFLLAALGLIPVILSLRHHRPTALAAGLALYGGAAIGVLLIQNRLGWHVPERWAGDLVAVLGGLLPAIICLQRAPAYGCHMTFGCYRT